MILLADSEGIRTVWSGPLLTRRHIFCSRSHIVELQLLEHLCDHEKLIESWVVRANEGSSWRKIGKQISLILGNLSIFYTISVCWVYLLESPHRGDSNEYTQHTIS